MAVDYGIGGNEVKHAGSEGIADIPSNRTMFTTLLTKDAPPNPELVQGLDTVDAVFNHYKPNIDITFENEERQPVQENFAFKNVGDFNIDKMTEQSTFLNDLSINKELYAQAAKQLGSNKVLKRAISDPKTRASVVTLLESMVDELKDVDKTTDNL